MSSGPSNAFDLAKTVLAGLEAQFALDDVDLPDRRYVTAFAPVATCDTMVVQFGSIVTGVPGTTEAPRQASRAATRSAVLAVTIFRCLAATLSGDGVELTQALDVGALEADAEQVMTDAYMLHRAALRAKFADAFRPAEAVLIGPAVPIQPLGGIGGVTMTLTLELS